MSVIWERYFMSHEAIVFIYDVDLPPPALNDKIADADRLKDRLKKIGVHNMAIPLHVLKRLPAELRVCALLT